MKQAIERTTEAMQKLKAELIHHNKQRRLIEAMEKLGGRRNEV